MENIEYLAFFRLEGSLVEDGYFDARKSADILMGIDNTFRYYLHKKSPELADIDFELPVCIRKGSWETIIPENIGDWLRLVVGSGITTYSITALKTMAQNDIGDAGFKDVFKSIIKSIKWTINIGKHLGTLKKRKFENAKFKTVEGVQFIGIPNEDNEILYVPKEFYDNYTEMPESLLSRIVSTVEEERNLRIGFSPKEMNDENDTDGDVTVSINDKFIFYQKPDEDDILFPDLKHNQYVELEGHITRGNENANSIGFRYKEHILTCYPSIGGIVKDSDFFFKDCIIRGYIDRLDANGLYIEKRPKIRYLDIIMNENDSEKKEQNLF
jgi:hypothetical protein